MGKKKTIDYLDTFMFPDIPMQKYPVYALSESEHVVNIKAMLYPSSKSKKKFTRRKQLVYRSLQAKIFDSICNIGYFDPLPVIREYPIIIQNSNRLEEQDGLWYLMDYFFPTMGIAVELDSDLHNPWKDAIRDKYLKDVLGIQTFRMSGFERESVQKGKFHELTKLLRSVNPMKGPMIFDFMKDIRKKVDKKTLDP